MNVILLFWAAAASKALPSACQSVWRSFLPITTRTGSLTLPICCAVSYVHSSRVKGKFAGDARLMSTIRATSGKAGSGDMDLPDRKSAIALS